MAKVTACYELEIPEIGEVIPIKIDPDLGFDGILEDTCVIRSIKKTLGVLNLPDPKIFNIRIPKVRFGDQVYLITTVGYEQPKVLAQFDPSRMLLTAESQWWRYPRCDAGSFKQWLQRCSQSDFSIKRVEVSPYADGEVWYFPY